MAAGKYKVNHGEIEPSVRHERQARIFALGGPMVDRCAFLDYVKNPEALEWEISSLQRDLALAQRLGSAEPTPPPDFEDRMALLQAIVDLGVARGFKDEKYTPNISSPLERHPILSAPKTIRHASH